LIAAVPIKWKIMFHCLITLGWSNIFYFHKLCFFLEFISAHNLSCETWWPFPKTETDFLMGEQQICMCVPLTAWNKCDWARYYGHVCRKLNFHFGHAPRSRVTFHYSSIKSASFSKSALYYYKLTRRPIINERHNPFLSRLCALLKDASPDARVAPPTPQTPKAALGILSFRPANNWVGHSPANKIDVFVFSCYWVEATGEWVLLPARSWILSESFLGYSPAQCCGNTAISLKISGMTDFR
jgi:hypothetical protein